MDVLCVACGEKEKLPVSDQITVATAESDFAGEGLCCGNCGAIIVEPPIGELDEEYEFEDESEFENDQEGGDLDID